MGAKRKTWSKTAHSKSTEMLVSDSSSNDSANKSKKNKLVQHTKDLKVASKQQQSSERKLYKSDSSSNSSESSSVHKSSHKSSNAQGRKLININLLKSCTSEPDVMSKQLKQRDKIPTSKQPPCKRQYPGESVEEKPHKISKNYSSPEDKSKYSVPAKKCLYQDKGNPKYDINRNTLKASHSEISKEEVEFNSVKENAILEKKRNYGIPTNDKTKMEIPTRNKARNDMEMISWPIILESSQSFRNIVLGSCQFVDKTKFIKEIIKENSCSIIITRPRRWGKSINLDMLRIFFQPQLDENGFTHFTDEIDNSTLFKGGKVIYKRKTNILRRLKIFNEEEFKYQGTFPVLFIKFCSISDRPGVDSISNIDSTLRQSIAEAYKNHPYIYKKLLVKEIKKYSDARFDSCQTEIEELRNMVQARGIAISEELKIFQEYWLEDQNSSLPKSLRTLIDYIYQYFNTEIYVLIDEYDEPMNSSIGKSHYQYVESTMKCIYSFALKDNIKIQKTIMVGILPPTTHSLSSEINNFTTFTIMNRRFTEHFGFNEEEVRSLMGVVFQNDQEAIKSVETKIKQWCNGYNIVNQTVYNPWSICRSLSAYLRGHPNPFQAFGAKSGSIELIRNCFDKLPKKKRLDKLICRGSVNYAIDENLKFEGAMNESKFFSLLIHAGYLTRSRARSDVITDTGSMIRGEGISEVKRIVRTKEENLYVIPNEEVKHSLFKGISAIWMKNRLGVDPEIALECTKKLAKHLSNSKKYINLLSKYLTEFQALIKSETDMQVFIGGSAIIACLDKVSHHRAYAEYRTTADSAIDHIFIPIAQLSHTIIIHQYKRIIDKNINEGVIREWLESTCWQIYAQDYLPTACNLYLKCEDSMHWTVMSTRSILLYKRREDDEWKLRCVWFDHDIKQVKILTEIFSQTKEKIRNHELLSIHGEAGKSERHAFLGHMRERCRNIFDLLGPHSNKNFFTKISETEKITSSSW